MTIMELDSTSISTTVQVYDDDGLPITGLVAATFPAVAWKRAGASPAIAISLSDLASIVTAYTSGGLKEISNGRYRLDLPNTLWSSASYVSVWGEASGQHMLPLEFDVKSTVLFAGDLSDIAGALNGSTITPNTLFDDESEELNVKRTDDYTSNTDQEITFTATGFPEFPADSVYFRASRNGTLIFDAVLCETAVLSATEQTVTLELTRDQIVLLNYGAIDDYRFRCTYVENTADPEDPDNGEYRTIRWGKIDVERVGA